MNTLIKHSVISLTGQLATHLTVLIKGIKLYVIWVTVLDAEETLQLLEVNGSLFVFTVNASHYLQLLLKMSLCLLLIKVRVTTSTFSRACTYADRHIHTNAHAHRHYNPLLLPQRRVEQMLRNLRCKRELGLPPHPHPHPVPHLSLPSSTYTHALTQPVLQSNTHKSTYTTPKTWTYIFLVSTPLGVICLDGHAYTWVYKCMRKSRQKHTCTHALWPTSPSRLALLIRGTMWHSIPSGTRHRLCQLCIVLCPLESTRPNHGPSLPLSLFLCLSFIAFPLVYCIWTEMDVVCLLLVSKVHQNLRWIGVCLWWNTVGKSSSRTSLSAFVSRQLSSLYLIQIVTIVVKHWRWWLISWIAFKMKQKLYHNR